MVNKKIIFIILVLAAAGLIGLALRFLSGDEDTWICQNGEWVKHGNPSSLKPMTPCAEPSQNEPEIVVASPQANQTITTPLVVEGEAKGTWFFEASFPIKLMDKDRNELAIGYVQARSDWMTEDFVPFKGELKFISRNESDGFLVLQNDNPSGLPEYAKEFRVPVKIAKTETIKINAYFNNDKLDPEFSCNKVFPVEREIAKTQAVARAAIEELLGGVTEKEKSDGYLTNINSGVKLNTVTIENGVAKADFDPQLEYQVGGSCRVAAIRAQITETLKQFPTVQDVVISINGRTEDILQP